MLPPRNEIRKSEQTLYNRLTQSGGSSGGLLSPAASLLGLALRLVILRAQVPRPPFALLFALPPIRIGFAINSVRFRFLLALLLFLRLSIDVLLLSLLHFGPSRGDHHFALRIMLCLSVFDFGYRVKFDAGQRRGEFVIRKRNRRLRFFIHRFGFFNLLALEHFLYAISRARRLSNWIHLAEFHVDRHFAVARAQVADAHAASDDNSGAFALAFQVELELRREDRFCIRWR